MTDTWQRLMKLPVGEDVLAEPKRSLLRQWCRENRGCVGSAEALSRLIGPSDLCEIYDRLESLEAEIESTKAIVREAMAECGTSTTTHHLLRKTGVEWVDHLGQVHGGEVTEPESTEVWFQIGGTMPRNLHSDEMAHQATIARLKLGLAAGAPVVFRIPPWIFWSPKHLPDGVSVEQFPNLDAIDSTVIAAVRAAT